MKAKRFSKHTLIGILLGLLLTPGLLTPPAAQAQWAVFDATNYAAKLEEMAREVDRWMTTVQHYADMADKMTKQITSLGGILTTVDKELSRNKDLVASISTIGQTIRQLYQLKQQVENMVQCRIRAIQQLDSRLRAGILNPQQDLQDLQDYLRDTIGRSAQDTIANQLRLANADNEFERLQYELQLAYTRLADAEANYKAFQKMLEVELAKPENERYQVATLQNAIATVKVQIEQIRAQINDLTAKIAAKMKQYQISLSVRADYAQKVHEQTVAWEATVPVREDMLKAIDDEFAQDEGIDDDPVDGRFTMDPYAAAQPILQPSPSPR